MKRLWLYMGILMVVLPLQGFCELEDQPAMEVDGVDERGVEEAYFYDPCSMDTMEDCPTFNPPVYPCVYCSPCSSHWLVSADYLYWQLRSEELPYAIVNNPTAVVGTQFTNFQDLKRVKPDFNSGVRLGLDYLSSCLDGWDLSAQWTYFHSHKSADAQASTTVGGVGELFPIWLTQDPNTIVSGNSAHATHRFTINIADISFGRAFCAGKRLSLHPLAGIRGVWMDQNLNVAYGLVQGDNTVFAENKINCKGSGVRVGLDTKLALCYGFSFLARSNLNLLWTKFSVNQRQLDPFHVLAVSGVLNSIKDSIHTITPVVELFLGFVWERLLCNSSYYVNAHIGWEEQYFLNGIQFNQYTSYGRPGFANSINIHQLGSLGLGGLTVGVTVGF